jgi:hypothetical protein
MTDEELVEIADQIVLLLARANAHLEEYCDQQLDRRPVDKLWAEVRRLRKLVGDTHGDECAEKPRMAKWERRMRKMRGVLAYDLNGTEWRVDSLYGGAMGFGDTPQAAIAAAWKAYKAWRTPSLSELNKKMLSR